MTKSLICLFFVVILVNAGGFYSKFYPLAEEIVSHMSLEQKIGQTLQVDFAQMNQRYPGKTDYSQILEYQLGSVLVGGNGCPDGQGNLQNHLLIQGNVREQDNYRKATMDNWIEVTQIAIKNTINVNTQYGDVKIKLLLGTDAVHGNQHVLGQYEFNQLLYKGEILFPHNIGLAASHNTENFINAAKWNRISVKKSGFNYIFAPTVAVSHNYQWGRFYETMGSDSEQVYQYAKAYIAEVQNINQDYLEGVLASAKHFVGDSATINGNNAGNCKVYDMKTFLEENLKGYKGALEANAGNFMVSQSAINDHDMTINSAILQGLLKDELQFDGFLITDYDGVGMVAHTGKPASGVKMELRQAYLMAFSAGIDMIMHPTADDNTVYEYFKIVKSLLNEDDLHISRINNAVKRILAVKLAMKLIEVPEVLASKYNYNQTQPEQSQTYSKDDEYADALKAAQESLVLLQNKNSLLPLNKDKIKYIILIGERTIHVQTLNVDMVFQDFDNIGAQNGGWSIKWHGYEGNEYWSGDLKSQSRASSIYDGLNRILEDKFAKILRTTYTDNKDLLNIEEQRNRFLNQLKDLLPDMNNENTVLIGVLAESPQIFRQYMVVRYSEFMGDINSKYCYGTTELVEGCPYNMHADEYQPLQQRTSLEINYDPFSKKIIELVRRKDKDISLITILFSGRPMIVNQVLEESEAFIAAWLPGTSGGDAIVNAIFGNYLFRNSNDLNTLPVSWVKNMDSLAEFPIYDGSGRPSIKNALFEAGFGLPTI